MTAAGTGTGGATGAPARSRRVLLVVEQLRRTVPGGIGRYATGLLRGLDAMEDAGDEVPELILYASRPPTDPDPLGAYGREVVSSRLPGPVLTRAWDRGLIDVPGGTDVVHATSLATPPARRVPLVVTIHDMAWRTVPETFPRHGRRWHEAALGRARRRATKVVVPSEQGADQVAGAGVAAASIAVIPHGCDHLPGPDHRSATALLDTLKVEGDFLLSVGTLEPRKNLARLVEAYEHARPRLPAPWPLIVVGPRGWGEGPGWAGGEGRPAGVVPTGPVDDATLAALYQRARLLAYVPLSEGFGFPPVEAMRAGLPVVCSPMPSLGGAGLVVDPVLVDDIADALVTAATDERRRQELTAGGRERTKDMTWLSSARTHVALWGTVA